MEERNFTESRNFKESGNVRPAFQLVEFLPARVGLNYPKIVSKVMRSTKWF